MLLYGLFIDFIVFHLLSTWCVCHHFNKVLMYVCMYKKLISLQHRVIAIKSVHTSHISAVFDAINHQVLIDRLVAQFGVCDAVSRWLRSYLTSWYQFVKLGQQSSNISLCDAGVPQGSVLAPLLFHIIHCLLYTSDAADE